MDLAGSEGQPPGATGTSGSAEVALLRRRKQVGRPIRTRQQLVSLLVADEPFPHSVELHRSVHAVRDVAEVTERGREMPFLDGGFQLVRLARAYAIDEVLEVDLARIVLTLRRQRGTGLVL